MPRWIVVATVLDAESTRVRNLANLECDEAEAKRKFFEILNTYDRGVSKVIRREIFKFTENSYLVRVSGRMSEVEHFIQMARIVADTKDPDVPDSLA